MADEKPIGADDVARKQFDTAFRGFDQHEVRAYLARVATELASLQEREKGLRERLAALEAKPAPAPMAEDELENALGAETTRVLHAAREAAAEIRSRAEESVARLLRETNDEVSKLKDDAATVLARRTEEAEAAATAITSAAEEAAAKLRAEAEAEATAAVAEGQQRGREMVSEAQAVRERLLKDLSRRRKAAATQLERLLAGRERLLDAYAVVRTTLDQATEELTVAESEARLAADVAGLRSPVEDDEPLTLGSSTDAAPEDSAPEEAAPAEAQAGTEAAETGGDAAPVIVIDDEAPAGEVPATAAGARRANRPIVAAPSGGTEAEDRRSSSLRLLRRTDAEESADAPEVVAPPDDEEGVRIIRPEEADAPEGEAPVEDLFARLRADRAAAVASAEAVLADAPEGAPAAEAEVGDTSTPDEADEAGAEAELPEVDPADAVFEERDAAIEGAERSLTRALKRALTDEQNEVLDTLRTSKGQRTIELLLPAPDDHVERYRKVAMKHVTAGAVAGAARFDGETPPTDELVTALAGEISTDVRARVERAIEAAGGDDESLNEGISAAYREWKTARSEPLARHQIVAAYALGAFASAPDVPLEWLVDKAEGGCPDCDDNALAGPTPKGQDYPTGQPHPPAHAGCRCLVLPAPE